MRIPTKNHACLRRLLSGTGTALALTLAALPAYGQAISGRATGDTVLTNAQSAPSGITRAQGDGATIESIVTGPVAGVTIALDDNSQSAKARANSASQTLAPDSTAAPAARPTALIAGATAIEAEANGLIANQQGFGGDVAAEILVSPIGIATGDILSSNLELTGNEQSASAAGNAATAAITATGSEGNGAGIVSTQAGGPASSVAARVRRGMTLDTGAVSGGSLAVSGNSNDADAASNSVDNSLSVSGGAIAAPSEAGFASRVPAIGQGAPQVSALFAVLSNQQASGIVKSRAGNLVDGIPDGGPAIRTSIAGDADNVSIASDGNTISASADSNRSANRLTLSAADISAAPGATGAIADMTNVQSANGAAIVASTHGGVSADVTGDLTNSTLSIAPNLRRTSAIGNDATGNALTVDAASAGPAPASNDAALVSPEGEAVADAGFTVQNVQDYGVSSVSSFKAGPAARASIGGALDGSAIALTGNSGVSIGIGNNAANAAQLTVTTMSSSAAVNNVQSGNGGVTSALGTADDPDGMLIAPASSIANSSLNVSGNELTGSAIGNAANNTLEVSAATVRGTGTPETTGVVGTDYGATGTLALASSQKLGQTIVDGSLTPTISSSVVSLSGVNGDGGVTGSTIQVGDNHQRAEALGNSVGNRLTLSAATLDGAGAALSSSQYGQANVTATSDLALAARGDLTGSAASLSGNGNVALAVIDDASNALAADAATGGTPVATGSASAGPLGPPAARGTAALANQQFAMGSASATAKSRIGDVEPPEGLTDARFTLDGNSTIAEAAGNRVGNTLDAATAAGPGAALANSQTNMAQVSASAMIHMGYALAAPTAGSITGSTIAVGGNSSAALARGNAADNAMSVTGTGGAGATVSADARDLSITGGAVLLNNQANYGPVTASTDGSSYLVPLNGGTVSGSSVTLNGNTITAAAYGNSAGNSIARSDNTSPGAGIANVQTNYGAVTALVSGPGYQTLTGPLGATALRITGNSLAATAVGNQASSVIAGPR